MNNPWRWWHEEGDYPPENNEASYPAPHSVLDAYRARAHVSLSILARELDVSEQMIRRIFHKGAGLDSLSRRRWLAHRLSVPPHLLGLDPLYFQGIFEQRRDEVQWWVEAGYPAFSYGEDGYPDPRKVLRWYREHKIKRVKGKDVPWTQYDLGQVCDPQLSEKSVRNMEKDGTGLDSINRRRVLAFLLGIPPMLLGLDGAQHREAGIVLPISTIALPKAVNAESLSIYQQRQADLFREYYTHHAHSALGEAEGWITYLRESLLPLAHNDEQYLALLSLEQGYHRFIANISREQRKDKIALIHADAVVTVGEEMADLEHLIEGLSIRAFNLQELGSHEAAQKDIDKALKLIKQAEQEKRPIPTLAHAAVLRNAGLIHTFTAQLDSEHAVAQSMFRQALRLAKQAGEEEKPPYIHQFDPGYIHLGMAEALTTRYHPTTLKEHLDEAAKLTDPSLQRRHLMLQVFRARRELLNAKHSRGLKQDEHYAEATALAIEALRLAKPLHSEMEKTRIQGIYTQLKSSAYGEEPLVARLGLMLKNWQTKV